MSGGQGFSKFGTLLVDGEDNKVVDTESFKFKRKDLFQLEDGDKDKKLYFYFKKNVT